MAGEGAAPAPGGNVGPPVGEPGRSGPRHRARGHALHAAVGPAQLVPLAAVVLLGVLGFRALRAAARPGEGVLAAAGFSLTGTRSGLSAAVVSPDGLAARHMAVYAALTRAFARHSSLVAAGRELLLVATLAAAVLLWRTARRVGLGAAGSTAAVVLFGIPALLPPTGAVDAPARLAVPWLLAAAWVLAAGRPTPTAWALSGVAGVVAVLLAPDVALLGLAATAAALVTGDLLPRIGRSPRAVGAAAAVAGFVVVLLLRSRWDPTPVPVPGRGVPAGLTAGLLVGCLAVAGLAGWRLPRLRATAAGVAATAAAALLPHPRLPALVVCLPLAALLAGGLVDELLGRVPDRGARARWAAVGVAAVALLATGVAAVLVPSTGRPPDGDAPAALLTWAGDQLPGTAVLSAGRPVWAQLVHAGADERQVRLRGSTGSGAPPDPVLTVTQGDARSGAAAGGRLLATFGADGSGPPLVVSDPRPGVPTGDELARRQNLSAALLANPTTITGDRARDVLAAAAVDPRLLTVLAALAAREGVGVRDFPAAAGEPVAPDDGVLARQALVTSLGGDPLPPGAASTDRLLAWVDAQVAPFHPDTVTVTDEGVVIGFRYVSGPDALVTASAP